MPERFYDTPKAGYFAASGCRGGTTYGRCGNCGRKTGYAAGGCDRNPSDRCAGG
jgi:hypothetical protein